jgi:hypothetical protein
MIKNTIILQSLLLLNSITYCNKQIALNICKTIYKQCNSLYQSRIHPDCGFVNFSSYEQGYLAMTGYGDILHKDISTNYAFLNNQDVLKILELSGIKKIDNGQWNLFSADWKNFDSDSKILQHPLFEKILIFLNQLDDKKEIIDNTII